MKFTIKYVEPMCVCGDIGADVARVVGLDVFGLSSERLLSTLWLVLLSSMLRTLVKLSTLEHAVKLLSGWWQSLRLLLH